MASYEYSMGRRLRANASMMITPGPAEYKPEVSFLAHTRGTEPIIGTAKRKEIVNKSITELPGPG